MTTATTMPMDRWETLPWRTIQRNVFKVQKRIYQASQRDEVIEEPDELKGSSPVLKPSGGSDPVA